MNNNLEEYESKLSEVSTRLASVMAQIQNLRRDEIDLANARVAWEAIVALERKNCGAEK
jgi:hypothetical protein